MNDFYNLTTTEFSAATVLINLILSLLLQLVIVYIYKKTHRGLSYSSSFVFTFIIVGVIGTVVMMVVQHNIARAFGLLGAFSLIRFRTILKETRDIAFLFFALAIGIAVGTNNYVIALMSAVIISLAIWLFYKYNLGHMKDGLGHVLTFNVSGEDVPIEDLKSVIGSKANSYELLQIRSHGEITRYVFAVRPKSDTDLSNLMSELRKRSSVADVEFITGERGVEY